jgi:DNA polymerase V
MASPVLELPLTCLAQTHLTVPLVGASVAAGFPSPADDYLDRPLDFNELLIAHPAATFAVRVSGESMTGVGIFPGDIAVVDRSVTARDGKIILGILAGEFTLKLYRTRAGKVWLEAANPSYEPILITAESGFEVWGVVSHSIRVL